MVSGLRPLADTPVSTRGAASPHQVPGEGLRGVLRGFIDVWAANGVRRGFLGGFLIVLGALTPAYLPEASPLNEVWGVSFFSSLSGRSLGTIALMLGVGLMLDAWFRLRPRVSQPPVNLAAVLGVWSLPFLLAPPIFSADAYAYAAEGWLMHNGLNPYEVGVGSIPGLFAEQTALVWRWTPAPYGPLDLQLNHLIVDITGHHPYLSVIAMRIPVLIAVAAMAYLLPKLARKLGADPANTLWLALLNPLAVVHFIGGVHNDAIMVGLVVVALYLATSGRWVFATLFVAAAAAIKIPAIVAMLAVVVLADPVLSRVNSLSLPERMRPVLAERARQWRMIKRCLVAGPLFLVGFLAINASTGLGFGWIAGMNVPGMVRTMSPSTMIGDAIGLFFTELGMYDMAFGSLRIVRTLFMLGCVALILWMSLRIAHRRPIVALSWSLLAVAFCGPVLHGWYIFWGGSLLGLTKPSVRVQRLAIWLSSGLLAYIAMNAAWKNGITLIGAAALGLIAWRVWLHDRDEKAAFDPSLVPVWNTVGIRTTR